jgi:hypothetical protein
MSSGLDWHGNLELDDGYVKYSWDKASFHPVTVLDSRGRFVLGPMLTHDLGHSLLGHNLFLRLTGQFVAWAREVPGGQHYQINADDVYVQVGHQGLWDFMVGRFLTWRVFRKGLGFDLYTLEDTGARPEWIFSARLRGQLHLHARPSDNPRGPGRASHLPDPVVGYRDRWDLRPPGR